MNGLTKWNHDVPVAQIEIHFGKVDFTILVVCIHDETLNETTHYVLRLFLVVRLQRQASYREP
jgi:hypothetical protein